MSFFFSPEVLSIQIGENIYNITYETLQLILLGVVHFGIWLRYTRKWYKVTKSWSKGIDNKPSNTPVGVASFFCFFVPLLLFYAIIRVFLLTVSKLVTLGIK